MKKVTFDGTMENAYGKQLPTPIPFNGSYDAFENYEEVKSANELPSNDEVLAFVNNKKKANARQKAMQAALEAAGIEKPTLENDKDLQWKTMYKSLIASGKYTEEKARELTSDMLDYTPAQ
jgi:hypothetical protein